MGLVPGGVCSKFSGGSAPNFGGGVCAKFLGGCLKFLGGVCLKFLGGSEIFFPFFFNFFSPKKSFLDAQHPPPPRDSQCVAGTHPTGMHSFLSNFMTVMLLLENWPNTFQHSGYHVSF